MRSYWFPKPYADLVARLRVPFGFLLAFAFAWFADPNVVSLAFGLPIAMAGLFLRGWAAGNLAKNQDLATGGPYAYVRNPLYVGTLLTAGGLVTASRQPWLAVLFAAVFVLIYLPVIELEEQHLRRLFPDYDAYAAGVPMLVPRFPGKKTEDCFQWKLYWRNEEYNAFLGFLVGAALLVWKTVR